MGVSRCTPWSGRTAVADGLLWLGLVTLGGLHDFWSSPLGPITYERYNPLLTVPLVLFIVSWLGLRRAQRRPGGMVALLTWSLVLIGLLLLALGNIMEFWLILLQSRYVPFRLGGATAWPGAELGWTLFLLGCLVLPPGMLAYGIAALRAKLLPRWNVAPLLVGLLTLAGLTIIFVGSRWNMNFDRGFQIYVATLGIGWVVLGSSIWSGNRRGAGRSDGTHDEISP